MLFFVFTINFRYFAYLSLPYLAQPSSLSYALTLHVNDSDLMSTLRVYNYDDGY